MPDRNALPHSLEIPDDELKRLREQVAEQAAIIEGQTATIEQMPERIQELEARLAKDSHNSSRPPSSDSPCTKPLPRSRRQPSGRKPGGQPGRRGVLRSVVDDSDQCVIIPLTGTCTCGRCGTEIAATVLAERRHVVEVVIQRKVIEYRIVGGTCTCGHAQRSTFSAGIEAPVPYGPSVSAFAVYMTHQRAVRVAATRLEAPVNAIRSALVAAPVAHADETGLRGNDNLYWLHVLSTDRLTAYFPQPKRGAEALDTFGLLTLFAGVLVHDSWSVYERYQRGPSCASSLSCAFPSTTTRPNATCACPRSSRKSLAAAAPIPVPRTLPSSAPNLSTRRKQSDDTVNSLVLTFQGNPPVPPLE